MKDAGVKYEVLRIAENEIEVKIDVSYNFLVAFQKTWYEFRFTNEAFRHFQECLEKGVESTHGTSSIWEANKIFIKKQNHPNNYRNVRFYRRFFILGFNIVPAVLSQDIVRGIVAAKV
ncbi:hypothetical protein NCG89_13435 [Spongiibacter taiwanensis]|uniref:hypothetical protein n=1 Tax=Spongiibacter taiwanensis TaxID=1748242 RepID=UPI002035A13A|nr:hypothetical protein [Spongiibacter taiwanensis]USA42530.1 hypothetical protein NCG89_13435 [Spongiibacter taiwanensis]